MSMKYQNVWGEFWRETRAWSQDERVLALYLLTCEHRRTEGLFVLPAAYAAYDLDWETPRVTKNLAHLIARRWAMQHGDWVLIVNALRYDRPSRGNQMKGAVKAVAGAPVDTDVYRTFYAKAFEHCPEFAEMLRLPTGDAPHTRDTEQSWWPDETPDVDPAPLSIELGCPEPVRQMLAQAGFQQMEIDNADGALRLTVGELALPPDTDWDRYAREIQRARDSGKLRRDGPVAALRFIAKGASGPPRIGARKAGGASSLDHYKQLDAVLAAEETR